ncbi:MAG TPA: cryptochrome/photolyase family protein [Chryseolinea sp.]|nr:cryptochrome/photolyase family protein [Chryseolinea sp.]
MSLVALIFPHQIFEKHPALKNNKKVLLVEEFLFFNQYKFHKQKLIFHRASMKAYQSFLIKNGCEVRYVESHEPLSDIRNLIPSIQEEGVTQIHHCDTIDHNLEKRIVAQCVRLDLAQVRYESPGFMLSSKEIQSYFTSRKKFHQTDFYIEQRKRFKILISDDNIPKGGKWTYDSENRLKYPKGKKPPATTFPEPNRYWLEAVQYVEQNFKDNPGSSNSSFVYPTTFDESREWLNQFLTTRFESFGEYEDAMVAQECILNHSVLTPMLNAGLLTPKEIIHQALLIASKKEIALNSTEGFIRQIVGWREFIRGMYASQGTLQRTENFWKFKRKIPKSFWNGTTGILPIDNTIKKILDTGYCHHIERLMVLGNFMLLCEFDPDEVYQWFMELFIDAYDWVMVPNVYGMSQFADGGLMATKPYISGSNYLMKMSDFQKGDWQVIWDGLFWRFMCIHRDFFLKNPRLSMLVRTFDKMDEQKRNSHLTVASDFLGQLDT